MSKSLKNVVNPDEVIEEYGADTLRLYEMFLGPLEASKPWNPKDIGGVHRFLNRCYRLIVGEREREEDGQSIRPNLEDKNTAQDSTLEKALHKCIKNVTEDTEAIAYNTAISEMMVFVNAATPAADKLTACQARRFVLVLAPYAPHLAEEMWQRLGGTETLAYESWPTFDDALLVEDTIEVPIQINGKVRNRISVPAEATKEELETIATESVADAIEGKTVRKVIVVPGKIINVVVG
jgi:leucyl-tRNA synthetase